jgi:(R,R)-butanediol dehydrogenase/meso-butanediol dehydrogenase/diacetyl reductase
MDLLERRLIDVEPLITDRIGLDDVVQDGFQALLDHPDDHVKVLVRCGG